MTIKAWAIVVLSAAVLATVVISTAWAINAEKRIIKLSEKLSVATTAARINSESFQLCSTVNAENAQEAARQRTRADQAVGKVALLEAATSRQIEDIERETETFRTGLDCAALTPEYRRWVLEN